MKKIKWVRILLIISTIFIIIIGLKFYIRKEANYRYYFSKSDKYYAYDSSRSLDVVYGVRFRNQIDQLLNYYEWKQDEKEYEYDDISVILKMQNNTIVYAQEYLRDSTIAYVAFKHYIPQRKDSITWNYYVPVVMLHKVAIDSIQ
jgi:hypothetical protein